MLFQVGKVPQGVPFPVFPPAKGMKGGKVKPDLCAYVSVHPAPGKGFSACWAWVWTGEVDTSDLCGRKEDRQTEMG